jgi:uncharacterized NAD(P)/FAD-binding protein YdhS
VANEVKCLVIIGGGFSGAVAAVEFLRAAPKGSKLILINRSGKIARGLAYGTASEHHLLNVPVGNMSALVSEANSFAEYCKNLIPSIEPGSFVARAMYGGYLEQLLVTAEEQRKADVECVRVIDEVVGLTKESDFVSVLLKTGVTIQADHLLLAFGNFSPADPVAVDKRLMRDTYISDPWGSQMQSVRLEDEKVLLIGSGLTAVDMLLTLKRDNPGRKVVMLSRRGLTPCGHRQNLPPHSPQPQVLNELLTSLPSARGYLKIVRKAVAHAPNQWRDLLTALRPITAELWQRLPDDEKKRFIRHVQAYWDVHRHRVAPVTFSEFERYSSKGEVEIVAGRLLSVNLDSDGVSVRIKRRGGLVEEKITFDKVINCTGPCNNVSRTKDEFVKFLLERKLILPDVLNLGLEVGKDYQVLDGNGNAQPWLTYVGPMLKAQFWEATAVPELRIHAKNAAVHIADLFASRK